MAPTLWLLVYLLEWCTSKSEPAKLWLPAVVPQLPSSDNVHRRLLNCPDNLLPPACPSQLSSQDQWWSAKSNMALSHLKDHFVCKFSQDCAWVPTNFERVSSLRALMKVTDKFLAKFNVTYSIASGTLLGAHRCNDVLPWDADVDVLVVDEFLPRLLALLQGMPNHTYSMGNGDYINGRSLDMARIGFPGFELMEKIAGCLPLAVVDQSTGLFTDILIGRYDGGGVLSPWSQGRVLCDSELLFNGCSNLHFSRKCHNFSKDDLWPPRRCKFSSFDVMCPSQMWQIAVEEFGPAAGQADIDTRSSDNDQCANGGTHPI